MGSRTSFDECATAAYGKQCLQASLELVRQLAQTRLETKGGRKDIRMIRKFREIDYCGEMWYDTKLNEDNTWSQATGGPLHLSEPRCACGCVSGGRFHHPAKNA